MPKIQLKLMAALAALVAVTVLASGYVAERALRERELGLIERSLRERSELVRELVAEIPFEPAATAELDEYARRAAAAAEARVTLIAPDGSVVADSDVDPADLVRVENHGDRERGARCPGGQGGEQHPAQRDRRPPPALPGGAAGRRAPAWCGWR